MSEIIKRLLDITRKADALIASSEYLGSTGEINVDAELHEELEMELEEFEDFMMTLVPDSSDCITGADKAEKFLLVPANAANIG